MGKARSPQDKDVALFAGLRGSEAMILKGLFAARFQLVREMLVIKEVIKMILMDQQVANFKVQVSQPSELNHLTNDIQADLDKARDTEVGRYLTGVFMPEKAAAILWQSQLDQLSKKVDKYIEDLDKTFENIALTLRKLPDNQPAPNFNTELSALEGQFVNLKKEAEQLTIEVNATKKKLLHMAPQASAAAQAQKTQGGPEGFTPGREIH